MTADDELKEVFGGFDFAIRIFKLRVTDLQIGRGWSRKDIESGDADVFDVSILGKARSEDEVAIIGETKRTNDSCFHLNQHTREVYGGIRETEAAELLKAFFWERR